MQVEYDESFRSDWNNIKDNKIKQLILSRIDKIEEYGEQGFGDFSPIKGAKGLYELKFHHGAGYRVYFTKFGKVLVALLCGGEKSDQTRDIKRAKKLQEKANEKYKK